MIQRVKEIYDYRDMIMGLVRRDLRGRYKGSFMGFLWNFINPLCQIVVYIKFRLFLCVFNCRNDALEFL